jgi:catechol 2,3-dioxygenase-like lactoylglutathione lyase family enzyme
VANASSHVIHTVLAALPVRDMMRSEQWYTRLLGTEPDARPMPGLVEWHPTSGALQLVADTGRAGGGLVTLQVADLAAFVAAATERGFESLAPEPGEVVTGFAVVSDPDGNAVTIVQT